MGPRLLDGTDDIELALLRVGELLEAAADPQAIVIVGGAALQLLGVVRRATRDVDILAFARRRRGSAWTLIPPPTPLPGALTAAVRTVGRDLGLVHDWLNTGPALQWKQGLPPGIATRIVWRQFAALRTGLVDRRDLILLKLYAAADDRPEGRHGQDLVALAPTDVELTAAARWVKTQDASPAFPDLVENVVSYVRANRKRSDR
jgi:hypothetical protein